MADNSSGSSSGGSKGKLTIGGIIAFLLLGFLALAGGGDLLGTVNQLNESVSEGTVQAASAEMTRSVAEGPAATATAASATRQAQSGGGERSEGVSQSGLPVIRYEELPPEAHDTIELIEAGGPFPYDRDGIVFENREGILPPAEEGYYHEYTVITPGEDDRGARRIVTGEGGEFYYTDDHYDSFSEVAF
jgi:ribonuclease T1